MKQQLKEVFKAATSPSWFVVDKEGLRKTLSRKGKAFAIYELLQNGYDENSTRLEVSLTEPKNGKSILTCIDNAPNGYMDLSNAHTMFGESKKKTDVQKRGRFNVGEKYVLALCDSASVTSKTGRIVFKADGTRSHDNVKTKTGTEFRGELPLTIDEHNDMVRKVKLVIPPVQTVFNGTEIPKRKVLHEFSAQLPTEVADENGILRSKKRTTKVRLFEVPTGGAYLYEMGMPVVPIDCKWSVDVQQKVPLNIERDNVTPSYLKTVYQSILDERSEYLNEEDAAHAWVTTGLSSEKVSTKAIKNVVVKRFGKDAVIHDRNDLGSNREAAAAGRTVIPRGALTPEMRKNLVRAGVKKASEEFSTSVAAPTGIIPEKALTKPQLRYKEFVEKVAPLVLDRKLKKVQFANDPKAKLLGCTQWSPKDYIFTVNVAKHDVADWERNYDLFIHELAHSKVDRNDHLFEEFWRACSDVGAKLAQVALERPELFPTSVRKPKLVAA
ncbi:MAG TPA: hypothetical protein VHF01_16155 [Candidatus Acidoferrum sp.]|nr:hypothetical protein [Candidatus Acidoferrum sp.]